MARTPLTALVGLTAGAWLVAEAACWAASRRGLGAPGAGGCEAVIVLGYPSRRRGRPHPVQLWRCAIAARARRSADAVVLVSGFAPDGRASEASVMAGVLRDRFGVPTDVLVLEERATSTWDNIAFCLPLLPPNGPVRIASDPLHAARARAHLRAQAPKLARRLATAGEYRFGEHPVLKVATLAYELAVRVLGWGTGRTPGRPADADARR